VSASRPYLLLAAAVLCVSFGSLFVRLAAAPALAVAFFRVFLASLLLVPFAVRPLAHSFGALPTRQRLLLGLSGLSLALHFATWIASLSYTSVAASVLIVNTAPLFTLGFSSTFLGETAPRPVGAAILVAVTGAALIVVAAGVPLVGYSPRTLLVFLALAVVPTIGGHGLVNRALRVLPAATVSLFMLGEPVGATLLAYGAFREVPSSWTLAGGAIVLAALAAVVRAGAA
jgi:drug/metabolite transporter (DMT)-like permease